MAGRPPITAIADHRTVVPLLEQCGLPVADLAAGSDREFFGSRGPDGLYGLIGLERYGPFGLLRSLAVSPDRRGSGLGRQLVARAEQYAASQGVSRLFLLTTTAADLFSHLGYQCTARHEAPPAIRASTQFSGLCPATSTLMSKTLTTPPLSPGNAMPQLSPREVELVAIGAAIGSNCLPCVEYHIAAGRQLGISDDTLRAAVALADKVRRAPARKVLEAAKAAIDGRPPASGAEESSSPCAALSAAAGDENTG